MGAHEMIDFGHYLVLLGTGYCFWALGVILVEMLSSGVSFGKFLK
jgi:hypothetical protein